MGSEYVQVGTHSDTPKTDLQFALQESSLLVTLLKELFQELSFLF